MRQVTVPMRFTWAGELNPRLSGANRIDYVVIPILHSWDVRVYRSLVDFIWLRNQPNDAVLKNCIESLPNDNLGVIMIDYAKSDHISVVLEVTLIAAHDYELPGNPRHVANELCRKLLRPITTNPEVKSHVHVT